MFANIADIKHTGKFYKKFLFKLYIKFQFDRTVGGGCNTQSDSQWELNYPISSTVVGGLPN